MDIQQELTCTCCDKLAPYNCQWCGRKYCGEHIGNHKESDGECD